MNFIFCKAQIEFTFMRYGGTASDEEMNSVISASAMESRQELFDYGESKKDFLWWLLLFPYRFSAHRFISKLTFFV